MSTYAEIDASGTVTKVFENNGEAYTPAEGSFLVETNQFVEGQAYIPTAGNFPTAFTFLGTPAEAPTPTVSKKTTKDTTDGQ